MGEEKTVAEKIVDDLFTNGFHMMAERLVLTSSDGADLGGWSRSGAAGVVAHHLTKLESGPKSEIAGAPVSEVETESVPEERPLSSKEHAAKWPWPQKPTDEQLAEGFEEEWAMYTWARLDPDGPGKQIAKDFWIASRKAKETGR
jgi:hypothetical protein